MPDENLSGEFVINKKEKVPTIEPQSKTLEEPVLSPHKNSLHFFSSLGFNPGNVEFENQEQDEEIVLLVRRDLITNVPWILTALLLAFIPPIIALFNNLFTPFFQISFQTQVVALLFYYHVIVGFILVEFTIWYFNVGIVTNKRIVDLDVSGILFKHMSETKINLIEDVSYSQVGAIRSLFNYGDVLMQTAASQANFEFDRAPEPATIVKIIAEMIGKKPLK